jgi:hypothetical protein
VKSPRGSQFPYRLRIFLENPGLIGNIAVMSPLPKIDCSALIVLLMIAAAFVVGRAHGRWWVWGWERSLGAYGLDGHARQCEEAGI